VVHCFWVTVLSLFLHKQASLRADEILVGKFAFEAILHFWVVCYKLPWRYGIFAAQAFKNECSTKGRTFSLGRFGAHHQNGESESFIQTFIGCCFEAINWPEAADLQLWPFELQPSLPLEHSF